MICPHCKKEISDSSMYCPECGQNLLEQKLTTQEENNYWDKVQRENKATEQKRKDEIRKEESQKKTAIIKIVVAIIVICAGVLTLVHMTPTIQKSLQDNSKETTGNQDVLGITNHTEESDEAEVVKDDLNDSETQNDIESNSENSDAMLDTSEYILPNSDSTYITYEDLEGLTEWEVRVARNELMARHGRKFNDQSLQDYFNSCSWYSGTIEPEDFDNNYDSNLNEYEKKNATTIKEYEKEKGYNQ